MNRDSRQRWLPIVILATALLLWAGLLALGTYLNWGADPPRHDLRKPLIVFGSMVVFLAFWAVALWRRARRDHRK